jgi:hypothetical protein
MKSSPPGPTSLIEAFWIEKYLTYAQDRHGDLRPTDCIFLAEYALRGAVSDAQRFEAAVFRVGTDRPLATYSGRDRLWCNRMWVNRKSRSFDTLEALEQAHPATDAYSWQVTGFPAPVTFKPVRIGGPEARTQIPRPHAMRLRQAGHPVTDCERIDPSLPLDIEWNRFEGARTGPGIEDTIFVFVDDCHGEVVYFGGLPIEQDRIRFDATSTTVPAGVLKPGQPYTVFFSQCKIVDQDISEGLYNLAVNSFGVELDIRTLGVNPGPECPEPRRMAPFRWKRKTRVASGLETWPTIADDDAV